MKYFNIVHQDVFIQARTCKEGEGRRQGESLNDQNLVPERIQREFFSSVYILLGYFLLFLSDIGNERPLSHVPWAGFYC